jgi:hypothetical protein
MEFVDRLYTYYFELAKIHDIEITEELTEARYQSMWWRLRNLVDAELVGEENNLDYLKGIMAGHYNRDIKMYEQMRIQEGKIKMLQEELASFWGIKKTARRLLGNCKRKLMRRHRKGASI